MTEPLPDPFADQPDWAPQPPRPIEIVPAVGRVELRGQRVLVGLPGLGWRADLRADERVVQNSRTYVPVIPEHEWYRAESEQVEVFAPLVPVERVWVETVGQRSASAPDGGIRLVSLDAPTHPAPTPVFEADSVTGRRVVHMVGSVEHRDLRAVTEAYSGAEGDICVRVAPEVEWYRWAWRGQSPTTLEVPVHLLWVE
ncbi:hypothetical protein SAMN05443287_11324 [Micromonospora phaseoli]|uniref:Uncharacterized protein n=1 Tax=Micromonospora phaseoli TaxID=1144548 RepID=A0A1H7DF03_9ACTN|nr:hypothetical protein [Micromonospora phaseoli]PZV90573.1 hypothetical protein CLV64_113113 [Micromonospora phaseoli]GIJ78035.1 hypothetical protein Xph01_24670 [Micromonospora phaseoli]SEJ99497.1 hypothetical protein SAMN05443287_11324 [Micromonospora phaseoli]